MMSTGDEPLRPFIVVPGVRFQDITEHVRDDIEITFVASFHMLVIQRDLTVHNLPIVQNK